MTLIPAVGVRGHEGKRYDVNEICAAPGCGTLSAHGHHLWSRSYLRGQPYEWVQLEDGTVIGNRVGLCFSHHEQVTGEIGGYRARITFSGGVFWWDVRDGEEWMRRGMLDSQPPGVSTLRSQNGTPRMDSEDACPTCGHQKKPRKPAARRKSKTWTVDVPDDQEDGAEILDGWVDDIAGLLGFDDERSRLRRYHALAIVFAWTALNRDQFLADIVEAAR